MRAIRHRLDRYDTPDWMTHALLKHHPEIGGRLCLDPCCGDGRMIALLSARFDAVRTNDIDPAVAADSHLDAREPSVFAGPQPDWVITNPPFAAAHLIVFRAIHAARVGVAMLLRCTFLEAVASRTWLEHTPPTDLISLPRYRWRGRGHGTDQAPVWWFLWRAGGGSACQVVSKEQARLLRGAAASEAAAPAAIGASAARRSGSGGGRQLALGGF